MKEKERREEVDIELQIVVAKFVASTPVDLPPVFGAYCTVLSYLTPPLLNASSQLPRHQRLKILTAHFYDQAC